MTKNKILVIGHHLVISNYQELVAKLASEFDRQSYSVTLLTPEVYKEKVITSAETFHKGGFEHVKLKTLLGKQGKQHGHIYLNLSKVFENNSFSLIYCMEEPNSLVSLQVSFWADKFSIPIVLWSALNQDRDYTKYPFYDFRRYLYPFCIKCNFKSCKSINALDSNVKSVILDKGFKRDVFIQNTFGVNESFFTESISSKGECLELIYVGDLDIHKGVKYLISAVNQMADTKLTIVGRGSQLESLQELANDNITFCGFLPHSNVFELLLKSDVLILPSIPINGYLEQFGRVLIEAMAAGTAVIGSNVGGVPDVIGDAGVIVEHSNVDTLFNELIKFKDDELYLSLMKSKALKRAKEHYSYDSIAKLLAKRLSTYI